MRELKMIAMMSAVVLAAAGLLAAAQPARSRPRSSRI